jgi:hypothetical protein
MIQIKKDIMKLADVNGVGEGLNGLIVIYMVQSNPSTEKIIMNMLQGNTYKIDIIGEIKLQ